MAKLCVQKLACSRETLVRATMHSHNPRCIRHRGCIHLTARLFRSADLPRSWRLESTVRAEGLIFTSPRTSPTDRPLGRPRASSPIRFSPIRTNQSNPGPPSRRLEVLSSRETRETEREKQERHVKLYVRRLEFSA